MLRSQKRGILNWMGASAMASKGEWLHAGLRGSEHRPSNYADADVDKEERLRQISKKLDDMIEKLAEFRREDSAPVYSGRSEKLAKLRQTIAIRNLRNRLFPKGMFADPAWDMILDLTLAKAENRDISISSLCIAANVPTTTALRCIKLLFDQGIIVIVADSKDRRRKIVRVSDDTFAKMMKMAV